MERTKYQSPFSARYASDAMQYLFSQEYKFKTWRRLWTSLASNESKLGLPITEQQIEELKSHIETINFEIAEEKEKEIRHDVMAHIYAYGQQCPNAKQIIHLGATSCYVGDNTEMIIMREALTLLRNKLITLLSLLRGFAYQYRRLPCLAYTHLQPAQPTTVGKRASLWLQDFYIDYQEITGRINHLSFLGSKGTTGTQASFLALFDGDSQKVTALDQMIASDMGFTKVLPVSGQTYTRKLDYLICSSLSGIAQSAMKFCNDIRLLQSYKEIEEPFENKQVGSSAMPYKRNPMRCERITALARYLMIDCLNPAFTAASQGFERTLDDSANKRIAIPEAFLAADAILNLMQNVCDGLVVHEKVIEKRLMEEFPFMMIENILMEEVKRGGDRQKLHEALRIHAMQAGYRIKEEGLPNDLLKRIGDDPQFTLTEKELTDMIKPSDYTGMSAEQTKQFIIKEIDPLLKENAALIKKAESIEL